VWMAGDRRWNCRGSRGTEVVEHLPRWTASVGGGFG
jgi:hypothetical protein